MAKQGLYANINKRKRAGTSRPKSKSTITPKAYANMKAGFPKKKKQKVSANIPRQNYKPLTGDSGGAFFMKNGKKATEEQFNELRS